LTTTRQRVLLGGLLLAAAGLRFTGLAWGLRHRPHMDERYFVDNVALMIAEGDLDHRFYEYPGLFFYLLLPAALIAGAVPPAPQAYLAARATVALFGVVSVGLVYLLGKRVAGPRAGLLAAALLAISPVEVHTAHMVRPDVALESLVLLALLAFGRAGGRWRDDALAGSALGAAAAVKFTGLLLVPSFLAQRLLAPAARLRGILLAGLASVVVFFAFTPYAILHFDTFRTDATAQFLYHYRPPAGDAPSYGEAALRYVAVWPKALGLAGALLAGAGLITALRAWRTWTPLLLLPLTAVAVHATSHVRHDRFMLPSLGVVALLAGLAVDRLSRRHPRVALGLALASLALPAAASVGYVREVSRPGTRDLVLDWFETRVAPGAKVVTSIDSLGLGPDRYDVLRLTRIDQRSRRQALEADLIVMTDYDDGESVKDLPELFTTEPQGRFAGPRISVRGVPEERRPRYRRIALDRARLSASDKEEDLGALQDGRLDTAWRVWGSPDSNAWLQVDFTTATRLARVELCLDERGRGAGKRIEIQVAEDGRGWRPVSTLPGRPAVDEQAGMPSQVLLLEPVDARGVRILSAGAGARRWSVAELRLDALDDDRP
jgi:hypothetical protein